MEKRRTTPTPTPPPATTPPHPPQQRKPGITRSSVEKHAWIWSPPPGRNPVIVLIVNKRRKPRFCSRRPAGTKSPPRPPGDRHRAGVTVYILFGFALSGLLNCFCFPSILYLFEWQYCFLSYSALPAFPFIWCHYVRKRRFQD